jgi:hypothetical protein
MKKLLASLVIYSLSLCSLFMLPSLALALVNVTPDVTFSGNDVFQSTTLNVPIPSGITAGMLMVIDITFENRPQTGVSITGNTSATAWTSFGTIDGSSAKYAFYKIADAGDATDSAAGSRSWTLHCSDGFVENWAGAAWSGVNTASPFATGPGINFNTPTTFTFSSQTAPGTSAVWVGLLASDTNGGAITDPSAPVVNQVTGTSPYQNAKAIVYSATGITGAFAPTGTEATGFEWSTVAFFLNPAAAGRIIRIIGHTRLIGGIRLE